MDIEISAAHLEGYIAVPSSKSELHRAIIVALLTPRATRIEAGGLSDDVHVTISCLRELGAQVDIAFDAIMVTGPDSFPESAVLECGESG